MDTARWRMSWETRRGGCKGDADLLVTCSMLDSLWHLCWHHAVRTSWLAATPHPASQPLAPASAFAQRGLTGYVHAGSPPTVAP
eukprot:366399-Chlamydomonas_euryale.AAC.53